MAKLSNLAYVVFEVSDLQQWEEFAVGIVGMQVGRRENGKLLTLRMDNYAQRIVLQHGDADDLVAAGWELDTEAELEEFKEQAIEAGGKIREGGAELAAERGVEKVYLCQDPSGYTHEFFHGANIAPAAQPFRSNILRGPGFVIGKLGIGHILTVAKNYAEEVAFLTDVLGLRISDHIRQQLAPEKTLLATFLHSATGRHHSVATAEFPAPKILNHFMVEYQSMDDVGFAFDRVRNAGIPLVMDLGRHPNDKAFSFYVKTPSGFALEIAHDGVVVDDDDWTVVTYPEISDWGHKRYP